MGDGGPIQVSHKFPVIFLMGAICIWFEVISFDDFPLIAGTPTRWFLSEAVVPLVFYDCLFIL